MWKDELQLSTDQAEKMEAIMRNFGSRFKLRRREEPEPWSPQEMRKEQEKMEKEIEKILTEEQWRKFSDLKKKRRPPPF